MDRFYNRTESNIGLNGYNKICFSEEREAINMLINKKLLPGQLSFAYYYDTKSPTGTNIVAAVGPLVETNENHLFISHQTINELLDSVEVSLDKFDENIIKVKQELLLKLDVIKDELSGNTENSVIEIESKIASILEEANLYTNKVATDTLIEAKLYTDKKTLECTNNVDELISNTKDTVESLSKEVEDKLNSAVENINKVNSDNMSNIDNKLEIQFNNIKGFVHNETSNLSVETDAKIAEVKSSISNVEKSVNDVNAKVDKTQIELKKNISDLIRELSTESKYNNTSIIGYIDNKIADTEDTLKSEIKNVKFEIESNKIDTDNNVAEYKHEIKNDIAVFNSSIRTYVKQQVATLNTGIDSKLSDLKTQVTANDASIISLINSKDVAQRTYINEHDNDIKNWINTADASLYNTFRTFDSMLKDDIDRLESETKQSVKSLESRLDNIIDDVSTDLSIMIKDYEKDSHNYTKTEITNLRNDLKKTDAAHINLLNTKVQDVINETRIQNASVATYVKGQMNDLNTSINKVNEHATDMFNEAKLYANEGDSSVIAYTDKKLADLKHKLELDDASVINYVDNTAKETKAYVNGEIAKVKEYAETTVTDNANAYTDAQVAKTLYNVDLKDEDIMLALNTSINKIFRDLTIADTSIVTYIKNNDTSLYNYILNHDEAIHRWIAVGDTSLYNYIKANDTSLYNYIVTNYKDVVNHINTETTNINNIINTLKSEVFSSIKDLSTDINNKVNKNQKDVLNYIDTIDASIINHVKAKDVEIDNKINSINIDVNNKLDIINSSLSTAVAVNKSETKNAIDNLSTNLNSKLDSAIDAVTSTMDSVNASVASYIASADSSIVSYVNSKDSEIKRDIERLNTELSNKIAEGDSSVKSYVDGTVRMELTEKINAANASIMERMMADSSLFSYIVSHDSLLEQLIKNQDQDILNKLALEDASLLRLIEKYKSEYDIDINNLKTDLNTNIKSEITEVKNNLDTVKTEVNNKLEDVEQNLISKIDTDITNLNTAVNSITNDISNNVKSSISDLRIYVDTKDTEITKEYTEADNALRNDLNTEISNVSKKIDNVKAELSVDIVGNNTDIINQHKQDIKELESKLNTVNTSLSTYVDKQNTSILNFTKLSNAALESKMDTAVAALNSSLYNAYNTLDTSIKSFGSEINTKLDVAVNDLKSYNDVLNTSLLIELNKKNTEFTNRVSEEVNNLKNYVDIADASIIRDYHNADVELQHNIDTLTSDINIKVDNINTDLNNRITETDNTINQRIDDVYTELVTKIETEDTSIVNYVNTKDTELNNKIEKNLNDLNSSINKVNSTLTDKINSDISTLTDKVNEVNNSLTDKINSDVSTLTDKVNNVNSTLTDKINSDVSTLTDKVNTHVSELNTSINKVNNTLTDKVNTHVNELNTSINTVNSTLTSKINSDVSALNGRIDTEITNRETADVCINSSVNSALAKLSADFAAELQTAVDNHYADVVAINSHIDSSIIVVDSSITRINNTISRLDNLVNSSIRELNTTLSSSINLKYEILSTSINNTYDILSTSISDTRDKLRTELTTKYDKIIEDLSNNIDASVKRLDNSVGIINSSIVNIKGDISTLNAKDDSIILMVKDLSSNLNFLINGDATTTINTAIDTFKELESFLTNVSDKDTLTGLLAENKRDAINDANVYTDSKIDEVSTYIDASIKEVLKFINEDINTSINKVNDYANRVNASVIDVSHNLDKLMHGEENIKTVNIDTTDDVFWFLSDYHTDCTSTLKDHIDDVQADYRKLVDEKLELLENKIIDVSSYAIDLNDATNDVIKNTSANIWKKFNDDVDPSIKRLDKRITDEIAQEVQDRIQYVEDTSRLIHKKIDDTSKDIHKKLGELSKEIDTKVGESEGIINGKIKDINSSISNISTRINSTTTAFDTFKTDTTSKLENISTEIGNITDRLDDAEDDIKDLSTKLKDNKNELEKEDKRLDSRINTLANSISELNSGNNSLSGDIQLIKSDIQHLQETDNALNENINSLTNDITTLRNTLSGNISTVSSELASYKSSNDAKVEALQKDVNAINADIITINGNIGDVNNKINALETEVTSNRPSYSELNASIANVKSEILNTVGGNYYTKSYIDTTYTDIVDNKDVETLTAARTYTDEKVGEISTALKTTNESLKSVQTTLNDLIGPGVTDAIDTFEEIKEFLAGYKDSDVNDLKSIIDNGITRANGYTDTAILNLYNTSINDIKVDLNTSIGVVDRKVEALEDQLKDVKNAVDTFEVPVADKTTLGVVKLGYTTADANLAVTKDSVNNLYTTVTKKSIETALGYTPLKTSDLDTVALPAATTSKIGGMKIGFTDTDNKVKVNLDANNNAYVLITPQSIEKALTFTPAPAYTLYRATPNDLGGIKIGHSNSGSELPVILDGDGKAYIKVTDEAITAALGYVPYDKVTGDTNVNRVATNTLIGGILIGYTSSDTNKGVQLDNGKAYVTVPTAASTVYGTVKLGSDTTVTTTMSAATTGTANRVYPVQKNSDNKLVVNVPWVDTNTTYNYMTSTVSGLGRLFSDTVQTTAANAVTTIGSRTYGIQKDANDHLVVNVPWVNTTYEKATTGNLGLVKLGSDTALSAILAPATGTLTYPVLVDANGKMGVTVPWTNTTYTELTTTNLGLAKLGDGTVRTISGQVYGVAKNGSGQLCVYVPWTDTKPTSADMSMATASAQGVVKLGSDTKITVTAASATTGTTGKVYPVQTNNSNQMVVNVPWTDTVQSSADLDKASATALGVVKLGSDVVQTIAMSTPSNKVGQTYPVLYNASNQLVVNVPWQDTITTYNKATATADGLMSKEDFTKLSGIANGANNYTLPGATASTRGGVKTGYVTNGQKYAVELDNEKMFVQVPWQDTNTTYDNATNTSAGLMSTADKIKLDGIAAGANNYSLPTATSTTLGGVKTGYTENGKKYAVKLDSNSKMYVEVPWTAGESYGDAGSGESGLMSADDKDRLDELWRKLGNANIGDDTHPVYFDDGDPTSVDWTLLRADGENGTKGGVSTLIKKLDTSAADPWPGITHNKDNKNSNIKDIIDTEYCITGNTSYVRRPMSAIANYVMYKMANWVKIPGLNAEMVNDFGMGESIPFRYNGGYNSFAAVGGFKYMRIKVKSNDTTNVTFSITVNNQQSANTVILHAGDYIHDDFWGYSSCNIGGYADCRIIGIAKERSARNFNIYLKLTDDCEESWIYCNKLGTDIEIDNLNFGSVTFFDIPEAGLFTTSINGLPISDYVGGSSGGSDYTLPLASSTTRGGLKLGYTSTDNNFAVAQSSEKAYVNVPNASTTKPGLMSAADKTKLDGITSGAAAGFGTPTAEYMGEDSTKNSGNPHIEVEASGPNTAKVFKFKFWNLKGSGSGEAATYSPVFLTVS